MEQPVRIRILEHEYLVKSEEDAEKVRKIAQFVNEKFREIEKEAEGLSERKRAILAAFHIASDYFQVVKERDELVRRIERRAKAMVDQIDSISR